ncbi:alpha/beta-hydrolase [Zopfia rhizophila CBS 207.26]|uniref:Alpha/beta-hydrolase n=1 Tax=Zopfia rhizophila CBS 207.26 TaxID=1314779 RepID=A0A6A6EDX2_9PEZI|nr:alpha/beta-hydrolase [Zopfia rhizophila CBS 207.26]
MEIEPFYSHTGAAVRHGRARVKGTRMHYYTAGSGPALLLLHGTHKTNYYWYKLAPLLMETITIVAPDSRGFGYTDQTPAAIYDSLANAQDIPGLMTALGDQELHLAALYKDRSGAVRRACCLALELFLFFFWLADVPEMLISGKEDAFWRCECTFLFSSPCSNDESSDEDRRLTLPIITVGSPEFFGPLVKEEMLKVAESLERSAIFECGHSLGLKAEVKLVDILINFRLG